VGRERWDRKEEFSIVGVVRKLPRGMNDGQNLHVLCIVPKDDAVIAHQNLPEFR
jgi:hypothetical protein